MVSLTTKLAGPLDRGKSYTPKNPGYATGPKLILSCSVQYTAAV